MTNELKICPVMSRPIDYGNNIMMEPVYCQREKCQLWVARYEYKDTNTDRGHCGLIRS